LAAVDEENRRTRACSSRSGNKQLDGAAGRPIGSQHDPLCRSNRRCRHHAIPKKRAKALPNRLILAHKRTTQCSSPQGVRTTKPAWLRCNRNWPPTFPTLQSRSPGPAPGALVVHPSLAGSPTRARSAAARPRATARARRGMPSACCPNVPAPCFETSGSRSHCGHPLVRFNRRPIAKSRRGQPSSSSSALASFRSAVSNPSVNQP
jgi:hypothetical protein